MPFTVQNTLYWGVLLVGTIIMPTLLSRSRGEVFANMVVRRDLYASQVGESDQ